MADSACERLQRLWTAREQESEVHAGKIIPVRDSVGSGEFWPTPSVHGNYNRRGLSKNSGDGLATAVRMWRTPDASCGERGTHSPEGLRKRMERGMPLRINNQVAEAERDGKMWRTPQASEGEHGGPNARDSAGGAHLSAQAHTASGGGQLSPLWVEILMGYPLGWTDPDCDDPEPWPGWPAMMGERQCPYEPPRTCTGIPHRAARLKALGNAVVPAQAYPFFEAIRIMEEARRCNTESRVSRAGATRP